MTGKELKQILVKNNVNQKALGIAMGGTGGQVLQQIFKAKEVRGSTLERVQAGLSAINKIIDFGLSAEPEPTHVPVEMLLVAKDEIIKQQREKEDLYKQKEQLYQAAVKREQDIAAREKEITDSLVTNLNTVYSRLAQLEEFQSGVVETFEKHFPGLYRASTEEESHTALPANTEKKFQKGKKT